MNILAYVLGTLFLFFNQDRDHEQYYYGVNGKPVETEEQAVILKDVDFKSDNRLVIVARVRNGEEWIVHSKEKIKALSDREWVIRHQAEKLFSNRFYREYTEAAPGRYMFREYTAQSTIRKGETSRKFPLHMEGTLTEYYPNGVVRSVSEYRNNQLVSNQNWLEDGSPYIDSLFYSADTEPEFENGPDFFREYLIQRLVKSGWDLTQIQDRVIIGWVVMENGVMEGVRALQGKSDMLNQYLVESIATMPGNWKPATLNGAPVRYFMSIPLNFISQDVSFQDMGIAAGQLYYSRY